MILGLDVSHWNAPNWTDWASRGYKFAWIKATEGTNFLDPRFNAHRRDAGSAGFKTGAYHYFRAAFGGVEQANFFWSTAGVNDLPPAIDVESRNNTGFSKVVFADKLRACVKRIIELSERRPFIYTSKSQWELLVGSAPDIAALCDLWVADYGWDGNGNGIGIPRLPFNWTEWKVWQYTSKVLDQDKMKEDYWNSLFPDNDEVALRLERPVLETLHNAIHEALQ